MLLMMVCFMGAGCISTTIAAYNEDRSRVRHPKDYPIRIIDLRHEQRPYEVVGYIEIKASELYSTEFIFKKFRAVARKLGGDAVSDIIQDPVEKKFPFLFDYLNFYGNIWSAEIVAWREE